jgi:hypothetical protein
MKDWFRCSLRFPSSSSSSTNTRKSKPRNTTKIQTFLQINNWICLLTAYRTNKNRSNSKKKKKHKVRGISVPLIQSDDWKFRSPSPLPLSLARCVFVSVTEKPTETRSIRLRKRKTRSVRFFFFFDDSGNGRRGTHPLVLYFHGTRRFGCRQMLAVGSGASVIMRSSFPKSTAGLGAASGVPIRSFWVI